MKNRRFIHAWYIVEGDITRTSAALVLFTFDLNQGAYHFFLKGEGSDKS